MSTKNIIWYGQKDIFTITARTNIFRCYWHPYTELRLVTYTTNIPLYKEYRFSYQSVYMFAHLINFHLSVDLLQTLNKNFIAKSILRLHSLIPTINNTDTAARQTCKAQDVNDISDKSKQTIILSLRQFFCVMQNNDIWTTWNLYSVKGLSFHSTAVSTCTICSFLTWYVYEFLIFLQSTAIIFLNSINRLVFIMKTCLLWSIN